MSIAVLAYLRIDSMVISNVWPVVAADDEEDEEDEEDEDEDDDDDDGKEGMVSMVYLWEVEGRSWALSSESRRTREEVRKRGNSEQADMGSFMRAMLVKRWLRKVSARREAVRASLGSSPTASKRLKALRNEMAVSWMTSPFEENVTW